MTTGIASSITGSRHTEILAGALRIANRADVRPRQIKRKLLRIAWVLVIGLVGVAISLALIGAQIPQSEKARITTVYALLVSVGLAVASCFAALLVLWTAYVYTHVRSLEAADSVADATELQQALLAAVIRTGRDERFVEEIRKAVTARTSNAEIRSEISRVLIKYVSVHAEAAASLLEASSEEVDSERVSVGQG